MFFSVAGLTMEIFKLILMWVPAMHICMCSIQILKGGGKMALCRYP